jgi:periplasmic divalent cation tolerance protein
MENELIVVLVTAPSPESAEQITGNLLEQRLAACVNQIPSVRSFFNWGGAAQDEQETLLIIKTRLENFQERLVPAIKAVHPYQTPEIIALPIIAGSPDYLDWLASETSDQPPAD